MCQLHLHTRVHTLTRRKAPLVTASNVSHISGTLPYPSSSHRSRGASATSMFIYSGFTKYSFTFCRLNCVRLAFLPVKLDSITLNGKLIWKTIIHLPKYWYPWQHWPIWLFLGRPKYLQASHAWIWAVHPIFADTQPLSPDTLHRSSDVIWVGLNHPKSITDLSWSHSGSVFVVCFVSLSCWEMNLEQVFFKDLSSCCTVL